MIEMESTALYPDHKKKSVQFVECLKSFEFSREIPKRHLEAGLEDGFLPNWIL